MGFALEEGKTAPPLRGGTGLHIGNKKSTKAVDFQKEFPP